MTRRWRPFAARLVGAPNASCVSGRGVSVSLEGARIPSRSWHGCSPRNNRCEGPSAISSDKILPQSHFLLVACTGHAQSNGEGGSLVSKNGDVLERVLFGGLLALVALNAWLVLTPGPALAFDECEVSQCPPNATCCCLEVAEETCCGAQCPNSSGLEAECGTNEELEFENACTCNDGVEVPACQECGVAAQHRCPEPI